MDVLNESDMSDIEFGYFECSFIDFIL